MQLPAQEVDTGTESNTMLIHVHIITYTHMHTECGATLLMHIIQSKKNIFKKCIGM